MNLQHFIFLLPFLFPKINSSSISHSKLQIKISPNLSLTNPKSFKNFEFNDSQWEFAVVPKPDSGNCYVRLSYWFDREALLIFEINDQGGQGNNEKFVLYVGPEHPLKLIDHQITEDSEKKMFCTEKEFFGNGMETILKFYNDKFENLEQIHTFLNTNISMRSLNIAAPFEEFEGIYRKIWSNEGFYTQDLMDTMMWKGDNFTQGKLSLIHI